MINLFSFKNFTFLALALICAAFIGTTAINATTPSTDDGQYEQTASVTFYTTA